MIQALKNSVPVMVKGCPKTRDVEAEAETKARKFHRFHIGGKIEGEKKLVLLSFGEERIEGAYTLRNESEEKSFREMLTRT